MPTTLNMPSRYPNTGAEAAGKMNAALAGGDYGIDSQDTRAQPHGRPVVVSALVLDDFRAR